MYFNFLLYIFLLLVITSCNEKYEMVANKLIISDSNNIQTAELKTDSIIGYKFSRLTQQNSHGLFFLHGLDSLNPKAEYEVVFKGRARTNYAHSNAYINVCAYDDKGTVLSWNGLSLRYHFTEVNEWCRFKDSVHLKNESWDPLYSKIQVFAFLGNSDKEIYDVDSLEVFIKRSEK